MNYYFVEMVGKLIVFSVVRIGSMVKDMFYESRPLGLMFSKNYVP